MRVFLDANILFSAAKSQGAIRQLLRMPLEAGHECWIDEYVLAEARRNLERQGPEAVGALESPLPRLSVGAVRAPEGTREETDWLPGKDRPVLAAAIRLGCDALATGDRTHFRTGEGKVFGGVRIHSPRSLAESLFA